MRYNFPIKLRDFNTQTTPLGPDFSRAEKIILRFDGDELGFSAPRHAPVGREYREFLSPSVNLDSRATYMKAFHWESGERAMFCLDFGSLSALFLLAV